MCGTRSRRHSRATNAWRELACSCACSLHLLCQPMMSAMVELALALAILPGFHAKCDWFGPGLDCSERMQGRLLTVLSAVVDKVGHAWQHAEAFVYHPGSFDSTDTTSQGQRCFSKASA